MMQFLDVAILAYCMQWYRREKTDPESGETVRRRFSTVVSYNLRTCYLMKVLSKTFNTANPHTRAV